MTKLTKSQCEKLAQLSEDFESAANAFNAARDELNAFRADIQSEIQSYIDDKSDKWREGDTGEAFQQWCDAWDAEPGDEVEPGAPEYPEAPEV